MTATTGCEENEVSQIKMKKQIVDS